MQSPPLKLLKQACQGYIAHWTYIEHGRATVTVSRYHDYKGNKTFRQFVNCEGEWREGLPSAPYPLYGLDSLNQKSPLDAILICEGERKADILQQLGWPAVSTMLGADNVNNNDLSPLRYFSKVIILRDNDSAGISFTIKIASALKHMDKECEILVCNLCKEQKGDDIVDWIIKFPLYGQNWNGFSILNTDLLNHIRTSLCAKILECSLQLKDCIEVGYKENYLFFDEEPKPLNQKLLPVPDFPLKNLHAKVSEYLSIISKQKSIPVDFSATTFLALVGGLIGRRIQIRMRPNQAWLESGNVWGLLDGRPSLKKSPSLRELFAFIAHLEDLAEKEFIMAMKEYNRDKSSNKECDLPQPNLKRYLTDNCTSPKLRELFNNNPGGLILRSDELKGILKRLERTDSAEDRAFMLQCWAGLDSYNEDRIIRGSKLKTPLTLTWIGCIHPDTLAYYLGQSIDEGCGNDGFMQRFQMITYPDFEEEFVLCDEIIPEELQTQMQNIFIEIDNKLKSHPRELKFSEEAQKKFNSWLERSENDARFGGHPTYWESHLGKLPKLVGSLCIILHAIGEITSETCLEEVSLETLSNVLELVDYYKAHAQRCYQCVESVEMRTGRKILELVQKKKLGERFKAVDIYGNNLSGLSNSQNVRNGLYFLKDMGWAAMDKQIGATGRPSEDWIIHPNIRNR
ncbi:DUF3987 domain-containing protein [Chlamydiales bacterium]|nr:DUF3987 domain-containing protein [Chlamydiales bacterium]